VTVWVVRGGEDLKFLPWFESEDVVGIGWSELPRSPVGMSRQELESMLRATYPDASPSTIANNTGQVWNFVNTIALGDLAVVPLRASRSFRVGRVVGPAEHREHLPDLAAVRPVEWEAGAVASQALAADLRNALASIMTVFRPRAQAAERRLESVLKDGRDPGPDSGGDDRSDAWVFQSNPKRFDLLQALRDGAAEDWSVNQHRQDIQPGDRVWFRVTGPGAGIYAVGRVTSVPRPEANEFGDWRVDVTFQSRVDPPLLRAESGADPVLSATSALAGLMGTNLSLPAEADARLEEMTEGRLIPVAGREAPARLLERKLNLDAARIAEQVERDLLEHVRSMPSARFEELCALYLRVLGCEDVKVVGAATAAPWETGAWTSPAPWPRRACQRYAWQCRPNGWPAGSARTWSPSFAAAFPPEPTESSSPQGTSPGRPSLKPAEPTGTPSNWSTARNSLTSSPRTASESRLQRSPCPGLTSKRSNNDSRPSRAEDP